MRAGGVGRFLVVCASQRERRRGRHYCVRVRPRHGHPEHCFERSGRQCSRSDAWSRRTRGIENLRRTGDCDSEGVRVPIGHSAQRHNQRHDVVGGISIVKEDLVATTPIQNDLGLSLGYVMGADVGVPISPHVLIVPGIRVHLIQRGLFERSQIGLGSAEVQGGVAVRVVF
jgi:hypothetical protein